MRLPATPSRSGFTLVELLVVVLLIALALGVATPSVDRRGGASARADAEAIVSLCAEARAAAARRGGAVALVVDAAGAFALVAMTDATAAPDTLRRGRLPSSARAPARSRGAEPVIVTFLPTGGARGAPIHLAERGGAYQVVVSPWTGVATWRRR